MRTFALAPAAVMRVAQWPLDDLEALACPAVAKAAESLTPDDVAAAELYDVEYTAAVEAARRRLWSTTAGNPRFRAALAMSSPSLHAGLGTGEVPARRTKSVRHVETSLYRYLARAACRTEPYGMWTSVGIATFGEHETTQVEECTPRYNLGPDLAPYGELLRSLASQEPYLERGPYRLNPTLHEQHDGRWVFAKRDRETGALGWVVVPASIAGRLRSALSGHPGSRTEHRLRLQAACDDALGDELLELALEAGLLLGGLDLPPRFDDPWSALAKAQESLEGAHAHAWGEARRSAAEVCTRLAQTLAEASGQSPAAELGDAVVSANEEIRDGVLQLALSLGCPLRTEPRSWIRCDVTAGWKLALGHEDRARIEMLLRGWWELEQAFDTEGRRAVRTTAILRGCRGGQVMAAPGVGPHPGRPSPGVT